MAIDHFKANPWGPDEKDWHFLILPGNQTTIAEAVKQYDTLIQHPGLYSPVPAEWLHMTVLRIGNTANYSADEMEGIINIVTPKLQEIQMPELTLGPWWLWDGSVVLHITPEDAITQIFDIVMEAARTVLGERVPKIGRFIPHMTLAYAHTYHQEQELHRQLSTHWVEPASFRINTLSLVREWQSPPYYKWELVRQMPLGQDNIMSQTTFADTAHNMV